MLAFLKVAKLLAMTYYIEESQQAVKNTSCLFVITILQFHLIYHIRGVSREKTDLKVFVVVISKEGCFLVTHVITSSFI